MSFVLYEVLAAVYCDTDRKEKTYSDLRMDPSDCTLYTGILLF